MNKTNKKIFSVFVIMIIVTSIIAAAVTYAINSLKEDEQLPKEPLNVKIFADKSEGKAPFSISFSSIVTNSKGNIDYNWDLGNGNTSTDREPSTVFETNGTFICNLTVADESGQKASDSIIIISKDNEKPTVVPVLSSKNPMRPYLPGTIKIWSKWADNFWGRKLRNLIEILPDSSSLLYMEGFISCDAIVTDPEGDEIVSYEWILEPHTYTFLGKTQFPEYSFKTTENTITFPLLFTYGPTDAIIDVTVKVTDSHGNTNVGYEKFNVQKSTPETVLDTLNQMKNAFKNFVWVTLIAPNLPTSVKESFADMLWSIAEKAPLPLIETYLKIKIFGFLFQWNLLSLKDPSKAIVRFADSFTSLIEKYPKLLNLGGAVLDFFENMVENINQSFLSDLALPAFQDVRELWGLSNYIPDISDPNPDNEDTVYNLYYPNVSVKVDDFDAVSGDWFNVTISGKHVHNETWNYSQSGNFIADLITPLPADEEIFWHVEVIDHLGRKAEKTYSFFV